MTINEIQDTIIQETASFNDWFDMYEYLANRGRSLEAMDKKYRTTQNMISGCQNNVWLTGEMQTDNTIYFRADSEALITKGIIALLLKVFNNQAPHDIVHTNLYFIDRTGLRSNLSPSRSNGVAAIIKQIKDVARLEMKNLENRKT
jgi:cysteine desulfuration protein SufE